MSELMQYSEEWKKEMSKLPKATIIEIFSQMGIEKQKQINSLTDQKNKLLECIDQMIQISDRNHTVWNNAKELIKISK